MTLRDFLERSATPPLVEAISQAVERAEQGGRDTHLAYLIDGLLDADGSPRSGASPSVDAL